MFAEIEAVQLFASVTVTEYIFKIRLEILAVVAPLLHK